MSAPDQEKIEAQVKTLKEAMMTLSQAMTCETVSIGPGGPGSPGGNGHTDPHGEEVVEGEYSNMSGILQRERKWVFLREQNWNS